MVIVLNLLMFNVGILAFSSKSSYDRSWFSYTKRSALSCCFSIFFFVFPSEQKCQDSGQKLKFDNIKEWKIVSLLSLFKCLPNLFIILICCAAFLHRFEICKSNLSEKSISTPRNLTESSQVIFMFPMLKTGCLSCVFFPTAIAWNYGIHCETNYCRWNWNLSSNETYIICIGLHQPSVMCNIQHN